MGVGSQRHAPTAIPPGLTLYTGGSVEPTADLNRCENYRP